MSGGGFGGFSSYNPVGQLPNNMQNYVGGTGPSQQQGGQQQQGGYAPFPGFGMGGMPGRFAGAFNPMGGFAGGGMSNYGFGGSPFGYGGYSPYGYGPGSYSPWSSGMMGYGGGSGMFGGPQRPMSGFGGMPNYNMMAQQMAGPAMGFANQYNPGQAQQGTSMNPNPVKQAPIRGPYGGAGLNPALQASIKIGEREGGGGRR